MSRSVRVFFTLALSASLLVSTPAQKVSDRKQADPSARTDETLPPPHERALSMLERILQTSADFEDITLKLKIQAEAAGMLWRYDEARARKMFEASFQAIDTIKASSDDKTATQFFARH